MVLQLVLKKDRSVFTTNHISELGNGSLINLDLSFLYSGTVMGMPHSFCHGSLIRGIFQGSIFLPNETYHVEKSFRIFKKYLGFHSVIYRESDIKCKDFFESFPNYVTNVIVQNAVNNMIKLKQVKGNSNRRPERADQNLGKGNTCTLYLQSDPLLWTRYLQKSNGDHELARQEILMTLASHVEAVNNILAKTSFRTFDNSIRYSGLRLSIARTRIMTHDDCRDPSPSLLCKYNIDIDAYLQLISKDNHNLFCLAYTFTYRDFVNGVLGKAWIASPTNSRGGICEKYEEYVVENYRFSRSFNTGVITTVNYGRELSPRVSYLNFAHQIGHSLGALHDKGNICVPYGTTRPDSGKGNYLMFAGAISGVLANNDKFSVCSRDRIARVLDHVVRNSRKNCLIETGSSCGNKIVEEGEECDCGYSNNCEEICCVPRDQTGTNSDMCTLKIGKECSPSQGPCCSNTCQYVTELENKTCSLGNDCKLPSYCNGSSAVCPVATNKPDGTFCGHSDFLCQSGECNEVFCERIGWKQCFVSSSDGNRNITTMCLLACMQNGSSFTNKCIVSGDMLVENYPDYKQLLYDLTGVIGEVFKLPQGSPCDAYEGYCNKFQKCSGKGDDADIGVDWFRRNIHRIN